MTPLSPSAKLNSIPSSKRLAVVIIRLAFFTRITSIVYLPWMVSHVALISAACLAYACIMSRKSPGRGWSRKAPLFNSIRHTSSLPTQTCTWGGSKPFFLVLTTKRNCPP